jgi:hypothetical protein
MNVPLVSEYPTSGWSAGLGTVGLASSVFGWTFFGVTVIVCLRWLRNEARWSRQAHKLAARVDLALTPEVEPRVARYLRRRGLLGFALSLAVFFLLRQVLPPADAGNQRIGSVPAFALVVGLPVVFTLVSVLVAQWPRWKASGPARLAHLQRLSVRDTLTTIEWMAFALAIPSATVVAAWTLWTAAPPMRPWCWLAVLGFLAEPVVATWSARAILDGPSEGSDTLDLAWDDALRLQRVRELLLYSTTGTLALVIMAAAVVVPRSFSEASRLLLLGLAIFVLCAYFSKTSRAQCAWRKLWPTLNDSRSVPHSRR